MENENIELKSEIEALRKSEGTRRTIEKTRYNRSSWRKQEHWHHHYVIHHGLFAAPSVPAQPGYSTYLPITYPENIIQNDHPLVSAISAVIREMQPYAEKIQWQGTSAIEYIRSAITSYQGDISKVFRIFHEDVDITLTTASSCEEILRQLESCEGLKHTEITKNTHKNNKISLYDKNSGLCFDINVIARYVSHPYYADNIVIEWIKESESWTFNQDTLPPAQQKFIAGMSPIQIEDNCPMYSVYWAILKQVKHIALECPTITTESLVEEALLIEQYTDCPAQTITSLMANLSQTPYWYALVRTLFEFPIRVLPKTTHIQSENIVWPLPMVRLLLPHDATFPMQAGSFNSYEVSQISSPSMLLEYLKNIWEKQETKREILEEKTLYVDWGQVKAKGVQHKLAPGESPDKGKEDKEQNHIDNSPN